jgi:hypothetical protein
MATRRGLPSPLNSTVARVRGDASAHLLRAVRERPSLRHVDASGHRIRVTFPTESFGPEEQAAGNCWRSRRGRKPPFKNALSPRQPTRVAGPSASRGAQNQGRGAGHRCRPERRRTNGNGRSKRRTITESGEQEPTGAVLDPQKSYPEPIHNSFGEDNNNGIYQ